MFCIQCEQTAKGEGCTVAGVCGKKPEVAALQDLLIYSLRGLAHHAVEGRRAGVADQDVNRFTVEALFTTLTNVNFDAERFEQYISRCLELRRGLQGKIVRAGGRVDFADPAASFEPAAGLDALIAQGEEKGLPVSAEGGDIRSLQLTVLYALKGISAYAHHARVLGREDDAVYAFVQEALVSLSDSSLTQEDWAGLVLKCGEINLRTMELLDDGNTGRFGHPVPTAVPLGHRRGKAILVSGHDLEDLAHLLEQTRGKGIDIYTHGEMLPAHGYPELKKHPHLYGHFGTAWQNQKKQFPRFPGAILVTTNCLQEPQPEYRDNIFTTGTVGWPGTWHVRNGEFGPVIDKALSMGGFTADEDKGTITVGFARNAVLGVAGKVIEGLKSGAVKHIFLVGGCDGSKSSRSYFTDFVAQTPADTLVLTLACGKYRFFDRDLGTAGGLPRLLDMGQCNDAYSAIKVAAALAEALQCGVNDLPLSLVISWYEQKALAVLLTLLHLNIQGIRLGPTLPAFMTPAVLETLSKKFGIRSITTPEADLAELLSRR